jgi:hypothetical protein
MVEEMTSWDPLTDVYKSFFTGAIADGTKEFAGSNFLGDALGLQKPYYPNDVLHEIVFSSTDNVIRGNYLDPLIPYYSFMEHKADLANSTLLISDFFRYQSSRNILTNAQFQWLLYANLRKSINLKEKARPIKFRKNNIINIEFLDDYYEEDIEEHLRSEKLYWHKTHFNYLDEPSERSEYYIEVTAPGDQVPERYIKDFGYEFKPFYNYYSPAHLNNSYIDRQLLNHYVDRNKSYDLLALKYYKLFQKQVKKIFLRDRYSKLYKSVMADSNLSSEEVDVLKQIWFPRFFDIRSYTDKTTTKIGEMERRSELFRIYDEAAHFARSSGGTIGYYSRDADERMAAAREEDPLSRLSFFTQTYKEINNEIDSWSRTYERYFLMLEQGLFYDTFFNSNKFNKHKLKGQDYNMILNHFVSNIGSSLLRNITQYRYNLSLKYRESFYYIPQLLSTILNTNRGFSNKFFSNSPEFFGLLLKYISVFKDDPLLRNNWFFYIYSNPYVLKNLYFEKNNRTVYKKTDNLSVSQKYVFYNNPLTFQQLSFDSNDFDELLADGTEFLAMEGYDKNNHIFENDMSINVINGFPYYYLNLVNNLKLSLKEKKGLYDNLILDYYNDGFFTARCSSVFFDVETLRRNYFYGHKSIENLNDYRLRDLIHLGEMRAKHPLRFGNTRADNSFYAFYHYGDMIVNGYFSVNEPRYQDVDLRSIFPYDLVESNIKTFEPIRNTYPNYRSIKEQLDRIFDQRVINNTKYIEKFNNDALNRYLNNHAVFRPLNKDFYTRISDEFLFNSARQFIENFYIHSDSLYDDASPFFDVNEGIDSAFAIDQQELNFLYANNIEQWYTDKSELTGENYARVFTDIAIWPWLLNSAYYLPDGIPPYFYSYAVRSTPLKLNLYHRQNRKVYYPDRFFDPIDEEINYETNYHDLEEGSVSQVFLYPFFYNLYDYHLLLVRQFFKLFYKTSFLKYLNSRIEPNERPYVFREGLLTDFSNSNNSLFKYKNNFNHISHVSLNNNKLILNKYFSQLIDILPPFFRKHSLSVLAYLNYIINLKYEKFIQDLTGGYTRYLVSFRYTSFADDKFIWFTFITFTISFYYFIWIPYMYISTILRAWVDFPESEDVDHSTEDNFDDEHYFDIEIFSPFHYRTEVMKSDKVAKYKEKFYNDAYAHALDDSAQIYSDHTIDLSIDLVEYLLNFYMEYTIIQEFNGVDFNVLSYLPENSLIFYFESLHTLLRNELHDMQSICLPGSSFKYNIIDVVSLVNFEFKLCNNQAPLPQHRYHFIEFLSVLTGYKRTHFDLKHELDLTFDKKLMHFIEYKPDIFFDMYKDERMSRDNIFSNEYGRDLVGGKFNYKFKNLSSRAKRLETASFDLLTNNIWYSNRFFIDALHMINFRYPVVTSTDFWSILLHSEAVNIDRNLLDFAFEKHTWYSQVKNNLVQLQYKPGEQIIPFYLRFNRSDYSLSDLAYLNSIITSNLNFIKDVSQSLDYIEIFQNLHPHDIFMVQPENKEGLFEPITAIDHFAQAKLYLETVLINENHDELDSIILDYHANEYDMWYSKELMDACSMESIDYIEWLRTVEETKEWLIYLDESRLLKLKINMPFSTYQLNESLLTSVEFLDFKNIKSYDTLVEKIYYSFRRDQEMRVQLDLSSIYMLPDTDLLRRYIQGFLFPDPDLDFSSIIIQNQNRQQFLNNSFLKNNIKKKTQSQLSLSTLGQSFALQLVDDRFIYDINEIFNPLGKSLNRRFSIESNLQMYAYLNLHLNIKLLHHLKKNFQNAFRKQNQTISKPNLITLPPFKLHKFTYFCLFIFMISIPVEFLILVKFFFF